MAATILLNGVDQSGLLSRGSLSVTRAVNQNATAQFGLLDSAGSYAALAGNTVQVYDSDGTLVFAGQVDEPEKAQLLGTPAAAHTVQCMDWHTLTDRRAVIETYANMTAGAIVRDIITQVLAAEGIVAGTILDGPVVASAVFPYVTATQALNDISELTGLQWRINDDRTIDLFDRTTFLAPWVIDDAAPLTSAKVSHNRQTYVNRQYIRAGQDTTSQQVDTFAGDGHTQTFPCRFPLAQAPTVEVSTNGGAFVAQAVGVGGVDSGKAWYWNEGDRTVKQDSSGAPLAGPTSTTVADVLRVTYVGYYPIVVVADSGSAQVAQKANETGTSGVYEAVTDQPNINSKDAAMAYAQGNLRRFGTIPHTLTVTTYTTGLKPGQIAQVNLPRLGLSGQFLVSQVQYDDQNTRADGALQITATLLSGEAFGGWTRFFQKLAQAGQQYVIRANEVLVKLKAFTDAVTLGDSLTISKAAPENRVGYATVGFSQVG